MIERCAACSCWRRFEFASLTFYLLGARHARQLRARIKPTNFSRTPARTIHGQCAARQSNFCSDQFAILIGQKNYNVLAGVWLVQLPRFENQRQQRCHTPLMLWLLCPSSRFTITSLSFTPVTITDYPFFLHFNHRQRYPIHAIESNEEEEEGSLSIIQTRRCCWLCSIHQTFER